MVERNTVYPKLKDRSTTRNGISKRPKPGIANAKKKNVFKNKVSTNSQESKSEIQEKRK